MRRNYAALIAALVLGGCATPSQDFVVLLPDKEGKVGTVLIQGQKGNAVLNTAYATARTTSDGSVQRGAASQSEVKNVFGSALAAQPPRPISFTLYFESGNDEFTEESKQEVKSARRGQRALGSVPAQRQERKVVRSFGTSDELRNVGTDRVNERCRIFGVPRAL